MLSPRLRAAASYIRHGAVFADIGTDHALLPIYAVKSGLSVRAFASDVNRSPLLRAEKNIAQNEVSDRISCVLASGFDTLDGMGITDAAVCGMGGELIAEIIDRAAFIKTPRFRLIIQPMTKQDEARRSLMRNGFEITSEITLFDSGKYYTVICADFDGAVRKYDDRENDSEAEFDALYGDFDKKRFPDEKVRQGYLSHELEKIRRTIKGKGISGIDTSKEEYMAKRLSAMLFEE